MRTTSVDLEDRQYQIASSMSDNGDAATQSEAIRDAIEHYAQDLGYINGEKRDTQLRQTLRRFGDAFALLGLMWLGLTFLYPLGFRMWTIPILGISLTLYATDRALKRIEPRLTYQLHAILPIGGDRS